MQGGIGFWISRGVEGWHHATVVALQLGHQLLDNIGPAGGLVVALLGILPDVEQPQVLPGRLHWVDGGDP